MHRRSSEALLISRLYEAAVEPDGLQTMSKLIRDHLDIDSAGLWVIRSGAIVELANTPDIRESEAPYLTYYRHLDPWSPSREPNGIVSLGSEMFDERKLLGSEFYQDFARHYGMLRPMGTSVLLDRETMFTVATNRLSGRLLDDTDKGKLQDLILHIETAMRLRLRFGAVAAAGGWLVDALDRVSFGIVVCRADGRVLRANAYAESASRRGGPVLLRATKDGVGAAKSSETAGLLALVSAAAGGASGAMRLTSAGGERVPILVAPCPGGPGSPDGPAHALISIAPSRREASVSVLQSLFGLSVAQAQLCQALAAGQTFEQAATARGVTVPTMRSHFAEVLRRTGASNLRDLLRRMAELPQVQH